MNTNKVTISLTPEQQEKARYEGEAIIKKITFQELHKNLQDFIKNYQSKNK